MTQKQGITIEELLEKTRGYISDATELEKIEKAYLFAKEKHNGQYRKSGEAYIDHPLHVAVILTTIYADSVTLQAAVLHDVLEDCDVTHDEMAEIFGKEVTDLVQGVTKLSKIHFSTENEYLIDYYKKIIVGISEDVRVIIIKLADRLHNMRTLQPFPPEKQKKKARESLEILTPIAHHLGIHKIKSELEDLALRYLKPDIFYDIVERLNKSKLDRDKTVYSMQSEIIEILDDHNISHTIKGRSKSIYSIYKKLDNGKKFNDIYDLFALRILVDTEQECYLALGLIHAKFKPLPKRFKDYIASPKPNRYQSLHTTVFGVDGLLFEIQIRTPEMDEIAENGIAAHWAYKDNTNAVEQMKNTTEQKLQFFKSIMDLDKDKMSSEEFVNSVKNEVLSNNIYVYSPKGDIFELPKGSTPIDFAYKVHTKVGDTMIGAIVNNNIVQLSYELQNNDIIKINTNKSSTPSKEWLNIAKNTQTKHKIRNYFTKSEREIYLERGKESLEKELKKRKVSFIDFFNDQSLKTIYKNLKLENSEELYLMIGNGKFSPNSVINIIFPKEEVEKVKPKTTNIDVTADVIVDGLDKVKVNLAHCCKPVFDDEIIGYITKGSGISVHRVHCHNLLSDVDRTVEVYWNSNTATKKYLTCLTIITNTNESKMLGIMQIISKFDINVEGIKILHKGDATMYEANLYVRDAEQINKLMINLNNQEFIENVERAMK